MPNKESIITLDIEAAGIHERSYPIEVGIALADGSRWCSLIKPLADWQYWDSGAEKIHGISRSSLEQYGRSPATVAAQLNKLLKNTKVYCDCWVLDQRWLITLFQGADIDQTFTLSDIMYKVSEEDYARLLISKKHIAKQLKLKRHRASNDALVLQQAYQNLQKREIA